MQEIQNAVEAAVQKMIADGTVLKAIEDQVQKTVKEVVANSLTCYSNFGKQMEASVTETLKVDFRELGFAGYNTIVAKIVREKMEQVLEEQGKKHLESCLTEILETAPAEIKLSALVTSLKENNNYESKYSGDCTCIVEPGSVAGYMGVYLDQKENVEKYKCAHRLALDKKGLIYSFNIDRTDPANRIFVGRFFGFEKLMFQMYTAKTKLILDVDDVDTSYNQND